MISIETVPVLNCPGYRRHSCEGEGGAMLILLLSNYYLVLIIPTYRVSNNSINL